MKIKNTLPYWFIISVFAILLLSPTLPLLEASENLSRLSPQLKIKLDRFAQFANSQMKIDQAVGLSVAFLKDNTLWAQGFGYADLENKVPAKAESSYRLASITKTFTAIAVLQLAEKGLIELDADIRTYVPYFPRKKWPIPVRFLLGHLGGISHYRNYAVEGRIKEHKNTREAIAIFADFELVAEPGTKYHYSSYGFNLLGAAVESASGMSYGEYIKKNIFIPLGMKNSRMDDPLELIPNRVRGYQLVNGKIKNSEFVDISSRFAAGGTRSTVIDLMKYARGIIQQKLLRPETWNRMFTSMSIRDGYFTGYGMGWNVRPWRGHFQVSHGGSQPETRTYILIFPTEKFALAVASNRERLDLTPYITRLAELVLDEDLDLEVYCPSREDRLIYQALEQTFFYGLSQFDWHRAPLTSKPKELSRAFAYFNHNLNRQVIARDWLKARLKINNGFHPKSGQTLIKVGTWIAFSLARLRGEAFLKQYHRLGPLAFFQDYLQLKEEKGFSLRYFPLSSFLKNLIAKWQKDWQRVYTDELRHLCLTPWTDFDHLLPVLKNKFSGASIYPDYTRQFARVATIFLRQNQPKKALALLEGSLQLYPQSTAALTNLAQAELWVGNKDKARRLYLQAKSIDPQAQGISPSALISFASHLEKSQRTGPLRNLINIALELHPLNADLLEKAGDVFFRLGEKARARRYYIKALQADPQRKHLKKKIKKIK
ncbi:serine hydrolase [Candidatus Aminicenantes bacterium AC-334-K16]|jgi:CubicO group peptidase (beta-lactamase class C family)|nr:serine hydrolase [Candidatus Aminicenantes bacterium AC-334-K16]